MEPRAGVLLTQQMPVAGCGTAPWLAGALCSCFFLLLMQNMDNKGHFHCLTVAGEDR